MGCRQCLPLSVVQLKGKHCWQPHCRNGVVDAFGLGLMNPCLLGPLDPLSMWVRGPALNFLTFQLCVGPNMHELTRYTTLLFEKHQPTFHWLEQVNEKLVDISQKSKRYNESFLVHLRTYEQWPCLYICFCKMNNRLTTILKKVSAWFNDYKAGGRAEKWVEGKQ